MRVNLIFLAGILLALALVGCKKSHDLTGSWEIPDLNGTATFDRAGSFTMDGSRGGIETELKGVYVLTDKDLTLTNKEAKASTKTKELDKLVPQVQKVIGKTIGITESKQISWDGEDRFALFAKGDDALKGPHTVFIRKT
jgi:flagellar basal body rod protein FlgG